MALNRILGGYVVMKPVCIVAGIILMAVGMILSFAAIRLRFGWLYIPSVVPAMLGYQLYRKGKEL